MAKSIHERVRAAIEKREKDAKRKIDRANDAYVRRLERRAVALDAALDARIANGEEFDTELGVWL